MKKTLQFTIFLLMCISFSSKAQERQNEERKKLSASIDAQSEVLSKIPGWSRIETTEGKFWKQSDMNDELSYIPRILKPGYANEKCFGFRSFRIYKFSLEGSTFYLLNKVEQSGNSYYVFTEESLNSLKLFATEPLALDLRCVDIKYCGTQTGVFDPELIFQDKEMIRVLLLGKGSYTTSNFCRGDSLFVINTQISKSDTIVRFNFELNIADTWASKKTILPLTYDYFELRKNDFCKLFNFSRYKNSAIGNNESLNSPSNAKYDGEYKDGKMNGQGTCVWPNETKYVGEFKDGVICGQGTKTWSNGSKYVGEWKNNNMSGQGTHTWTTGVKYVGEWSEGKINGQGTKIWPSGTMYVGEWRDEEMSGKGTYTWANGNKYVGDFKYDKMNGQGTMTWPDGTIYIGEFKDGEINGQGTLTWPNGKKYVGEWKATKRNGQGTMTFPNGEEYVGEWKNDLENGHGKMTYSNGNNYIGEWINGAKNGSGTMTWSTGKKYIGEFKENIPTGQGAYTYPKNCKN